MERVLGDHVPVSIATALAMESLFGIGDEFFTNHVEQESINQVWVNIRTLIRNAYGSYSTEDQLKIDSERIYNDVIGDMEVIESLILNETNGTVATVFYLCNFNRLNNEFPKALFRPNRTPKQLIRHDMEQHTMRLLHEDSRGMPIRMFDREFKVQANIDTVILLTNMPIDLLNQHQFKRMLLLESHTGAVKGKLQWNTKLMQINGVVTHIPFNRAFLQLFGDNIMFAPMPIKLRRFMVDLGTRSKWNPTTTKSQILRDVKAERDPVLESLIIRLF